MGKNLKGKELGKGFSQRKDGRYEARATINGLKIDIYDMNLSKLKKEFEKEKARVLREEKNLRPNITLEEWYNEWFEKYKSLQLKSVVSRNSYDRKIRNTYISILGQKCMKDITQLNVQTATNELIRKGYVEKSIRQAIGIMRECFEVAVINSIAATNPCISIVIKNANTQQDRRVLTHKEQDVFLNEVRNSYYYEVYCILLLTGMRIGELSGLQWQDVDFENKRIYIKRSMTTAYIDGKKIEELTTPKTAKSYRTIPFFGEAEKMFKNWKQKQNVVRKRMGNRWRSNPAHGDLVFTTTVGSAVTRYVLTNHINKVVQDINLKEIYRASVEGRAPEKFENLYPHAFRHTFATRCFEKKLESLFIQKIMGHSSYSTTVSYTHILDNIKEEEVKKAGNLLD